MSDYTRKPRKLVMVEAPQQGKASVMADSTDRAKDFLTTTPDWCGEYTARLHIRNLIAEREAVCTWTPDLMRFVWVTDCGESFAIHEGSPEQNGLRYCCFCGRRLAEVHP
ncbi:MAG: hypothetical protein EOM22_00255 [Gammaproteobacteria bacterium]|nr:hypothetical protein [Gammaproteobacteria bacterium]